jgi:hypothetical protein
MSQPAEYKGCCFCGAVGLKVKGEPAAMGSPLRGVSQVVGRPGERF